MADRNLPLKCKAPKLRLDFLADNIFIGDFDEYSPIKVLFNLDIRYTCISSNDSFCIFNLCRIYTFFNINNRLANACNFLLYICMGRTVINVLRTCDLTRLLYRLFGNKICLK